MAFKLGGEKRRDGTHHTKSAMEFKNPLGQIKKTFNTITGRRRVGGDNRGGLLGGLIGHIMQRRKLEEEAKHGSVLDNDVLMAGVQVNQNAPMPEGTLGEANMDGTINVDPSIDLKSPLGKRVVKHETEHIRQIRSGDAAYDDNWVMWKGKLYIRQNGYIHGPNGKLEEGHPDHPWEAEAIKAEKKK